MRRHHRSGLILLAAFGLLPMALAGQQQQQQQQQAQPQGPEKPTELVFEREVFSYPTYTRRNPFRSLAGDQGGPRFEQLRLMGIIRDADPSMSVAVLGTGVVTVSEDGSSVQVTDGKAWNLKVGQSIGNVRVIEIRQDQVLVEVSEYGLTEQKIMQLETRRLGGTP